MLSKKEQAWVAAKIERTVSHIIDAGEIQEKPDPNRSLFLRPSGFSYCPLRTWLQLPTAFSKRKKVDAAFAFYVRVGTVIHEVMQEALQTNGEFVADWLCLDCKHRHILKPPVTECQNCGSRKMKRCEHSIALGSLRGHVDEIFRYKPGKEWAHIPIDYKSTSKAALARKTAPDKEHVEQLTSYGVALTKHFYVAGALIVYIVRDNPRVCKAFFVPINDQIVEDTVKTWREYHKKHVRMLKIETEAQALEMVEERPCKTKERQLAFCSRCSLSGLCLGDAQVLRDRAVSVLHTLRAKKKIPLYDIYRQLTEKKE